MKQKTIKNLYLRKSLLLTALLLISAVAVFAADSGRGENAKAAEFSTVNIESTYKKGHKFTVPQAVLSKGEDSVTASSAVRFPNGLVYSDSFFELEEIGEYVLEYKADLGGKLYSKKYTFEVVVAAQDMFTFNKGGKGEFYNTAMFAQPIAGFNHYNTATFKEVNGLLLTLGQGSVATYNGYVDLSANTAEDMLLELLPVPSVLGEKDYSELIIKFIDSADERNFFSLRWICGQAGSGSNDLRYAYLSALTNKVATTPYASTGEAKNGMRLSFAGLNGATWSRVYYDASDKEVYAWPASFDPTRNVSFGDFDDIGTENWQGFSDNTKVKMTIQLGDINGEGKLLIGSINGVSMGAENAQDERAPIISVNDLSQEVTGVVNMPFKVFDASVTDNFDKFVKVNTRVYYSYDDSSVRGELSLDRNGCFVPTKTGTYYIVYTAKDAGGNIAEKVIPVTVSDALLPISFAIDSRELPQASVGERLYPTTFNASGGMGMLTVAVKGVNTDTGSEYPIGREGYFVPTDEGAYKIVYSATDYVGQTQVQEESFNIIKTNKPIPLGEVVLPPAFVDGQEYTLSDYKAYNYVTEKEETAEIFVDGVKLNGDKKYKPNKGENGTAQVVYKFSEGVEKAYNVPVKKITKRLNWLSDYFISKDNAFEFLSGNINYLSFNASGKSKAGLSFINPINADVTSIEFSYNWSASPADSIEVVLRDIANERAQLSIRVYSDNTVSVNGGSRMVFALGASPAITGATAYRFGYSDSGHILYGGDGHILTVVQTDSNGLPFEGFGSGKVYIDINVSGISGSADLYMQRVCNQIINNQSNDVSAPYIFADNKMGGAALINSSVVINWPTAFDVLDFNPKITLTVTNEDLPYTHPDYIVTADDGTRLQNVSVAKAYTLTFNNYGFYRVRFVATDSSHNAQPYTKIYSVIDVEPPVITVKGNYKAAYQVDSVISILKAEVTDNYYTQDDINLMVHVIDPNGKTTVVKDSKFTPVLEGKHIIRYVATDGMSNISFVEREILVKS